MEKTYEAKVDQLETEHERLKRFLEESPSAPAHKWEAALYRCADIRDELCALRAKAQA